MAETSVTVVATKRDSLDPYIKILQTRSNDIDVSYSYLKPDNNNNEQQRQQKKQEDAELSIFEARRYFSESDISKLKNLIVSPSFSYVSSAKVSSFTVGNTAASSEVSWNSQTGLLRNNNRQESNRDGRGSSKKGWFFRRITCYCFSSKSVQVQETKPKNAVESKSGSDRVVSNQIIHHHQTIPSKTVTRSIDYTANRESKPPVSSFSFPTLNETLQSPEKLKNSIQPVLNRIKPVLNQTTPIADEEAASDASSDLFEIESFFTQPTARQWARPVRNSIDETETEYGYESSEASVTWSITSAEPALAAVAANFSRIGLSSSSVFSGCDKKRMAGLLSCRSERAVSVSGGQRLVQPIKNVSVQDEVAEKVVWNNGSPKLRVTSRAILNNKSSFFI